MASPKSIRISNVFAQAATSAKIPKSQKPKSCQICCCCCCCHNAASDSKKETDTEREKERREHVTCGVVCCVFVWVAGRVAITFVSFRTEIYLHGPLYAATAAATAAVARGGVKGKRCCGSSHFRRKLAFNPMNGSRR